MFDKRITPEQRRQITKARRAARGSEFQENHKHLTAVRHNRKDEWEDEVVLEEMQELAAGTW